MENEYLTLINKLKDYRISIFKTQNDIALISGLSLRTVANIENGKNVSTFNFMKYVEALGLTQSFVSFPPINTMRFEDIPKNKYERKRVRKTKSSFKWGDEQ